MIQTHGLILKTLTSMARQRPGLDEARCRAVLEFLDTSSAVRRASFCPLAAVGLSELKFAILVALFALDPCPTTPSNLASYTGATRPAVADAIAQLEADNYLTREPSADDRRSVYLHLRPEGRSLVESVAPAYLRALGSAAGLLEPTACRDLLAACAKLTEGAAQRVPKLDSFPS